MTDCNFQLENDKWTCTMCGWVYPRPSAKPPRRNCPKSPQGKEGHVANIRSAALAEADIHYRHRFTDDLTRIIETCVDCEHFDNRCNDTDCKNGKCDVPRYLSGCVGRRQWLKSLSSVGFRECPRWQDGQAG